MNRWPLRFLLVLGALLLWPLSCPAPLVYTPGEGWTYESPGGGKWRRTRAKDQLEVAQAAFDKKDYGTAMKAASRTVKVWPLSDYSPRAQYLLGRCYEAKGWDEKAFGAYQKLLTKYPKVDNYQEILDRQYQIANRFLAGKWFKLWGYIPFFPNMLKTAEMYEKIIKNGPYSEFAPQAQLKIGEAHEKRFAGKNERYSAAVKAYERAADKYNDQKQIAADALYKAALAYFKQAKTSEYDQSIPGQAIATFTDFLTLYPDDPRASEVQKMVASLKTEQARGSLQTARFYEKKRQWDGALVYYNEVLIKDPESKYAAQAKQRMEHIKKNTAAAAPK